MADKPHILYIEHIEADPKTGEPKIVGRPFTVAFMSTFLKSKGWTVEKIVRNYNLTPAQIHAAWAYYYDHQEEIERSMREADDAIKKIAKPTSELPGYEEFMATFEEKWGKIEF